MKRNQIPPSLKLKIETTFINYYKRNGRNFPWRNQSDPYKWLVTEILLQMTIAIKVSRIYARFFEKYPSLTSLAHAKEADVKQMIFDLGLYEQKSRGLIALARAIMEKHGGEVPSKREEMLDLPRVGPYIADATLCFAFKQQRPLVDRNFIRVYSRLFKGEGKVTQREVEKIAADLLPKRGYINFNLGFLDFAADICKAVGPRCMECPLNEECSYYQHKRSS